MSGSNPIANPSRDLSLEEAWGNEDLEELDVLTSYFHGLNPDRRLADRGVPNQAATVGSHVPDHLTSCNPTQEEDEALSFIPTHPDKLYPEMPGILDAMKTEIAILKAKAWVEWNAYQEQLKSKASSSIAMSEVGAVAAPAPVASAPAVSGSSFVFAMTVSEAEESAQDEDEVAVVCDAAASEHGVV